MSLAQSDTQNWTVMGVGPFRTGSIDDEVYESTNGPASRIRNWIPPSVAFNSPPPLNGIEEETKQYVAAEKAETQPVHFESAASPAE